MGLKRSWFGFAAVALAAALALFLWYAGDREAKPKAAGGLGKLTLTRLDPGKSAAGLLYAGEWGASPQLIELEGVAPMLLVPASDGQVTALDPETGEQIWQLALPRDPNHDAWVMADPVRVGDRMVLVYKWLPYDDRLPSHHAAVIDLRRGIVDVAYPTITFAAQVAAKDGVTVRFDPEFQHGRAGLAHLAGKNGRDLVYSGFSGIRDQGIWHGWLFEIDLDAWRRTSGAKAVANVFLTTPVADCTVEDKSCGGGIWSYAGPLVRNTPEGGEILVQTANGRLDLSRDSYAQSLIRLTPGLKFAPQCDAKLCAKGDPRDPAPACLASCANLFIPRLMPGDPPLDPADGSCRGKSFLKCLDINDWDFGTGSPIRFEDGGRAFLLTASKAGGVYLIDADHLGTLYDRKQAAAMCGTAASPCPAPWDGTSLARPKIASVDGRRIAVVPTFNEAKGSSAGIVGYEIDTGAKPSLKEIWRTPAPGTAEAKAWFREPPSRLLISQVGDESVAWLADNAEEGRLLAIRARDGQILANIRTEGRPMRNAKPLIYKDLLYLPTIDTKDKAKSRLEVYRIGPA